MSLTDSPSLKEYKRGIPERQPDPEPRRKAVRILVLILLLTALVLLLAQFLQTDAAALLAGRGNLTGRVIDEQGAALSAQVYILGVDRPVGTDADGRFTCSQVPAGARSLIITFNGTAQEVPVQVVSGTTIDLGDLSFLVATPTVQP